MRDIAYSKSKRNDVPIERLELRVKKAEGYFAWLVGNMDLTTTGLLGSGSTIESTDVLQPADPPSLPLRADRPALSASSGGHSHSKMGGRHGSLAAESSDGQEKNAVEHTPVTGSGTVATVPAGSVLEIHTPEPAGNVIQFEQDYGTLRLDLPEQFHATVVGFTGTAPVAGQSDIIDLVNVGTLDRSNLSYSETTGVLTVTSDAGAILANLTLSGSYTNASFDVSSDGAGGSNIFDPTLNPIVIENQLTGAPMSIWAINGDINNEGNGSAIEGFATSMSIDPGQLENFKIDTDSTQYVIDIYRLGYYGGDGARLISTQTINLAQTQVQPTPLFDSSTNEVDAGNWSVSASWAVPTNAASGVYFAKLTTLNGTIGQNLIPFVVTNGGAASSITFQTNDSTWEAYNTWGGYNLYTGPSGLSSDRANAVSYNRPININSTSNQGGPQDFIFGEEFSTIYWLEENGYNVSYVTAADIANEPGLLSKAQVYLDTGHDEYWSQSQYNNVLAAEKAGVSVASFSGNQVYWDIAYTNGLSGSANTTIVEYKDPWAGSQIDPSGTAGGGASTFQDPVNGPGTPQNALMGNIFQVDGAPTLGNITIPYSLSKFRFWDNTSVAGLQPGQTATLTNLLGYEWNTDNNNGFRPAGVIDLSSTTTGVGSLVLGGSDVTGNGEATHSLTLYRDTTSGALIFDAGTVMWSWGLDTAHTYYNGTQTAPVSNSVQQAMVNLFADMGVQPQTLMASLIYASKSTDTAPPVSTITGIGPAGTVFSDEIVTISGTAVETGAGQIAVVEISTNGGVTWNRAIGFDTWTYSWIAPSAGTYTIETRATNDSAYLETPSDATTVTVAAGTTTSLFTSSPGDVIPYSTSSDNIDSGDTNPVELGLRFVASVSGLIAGVRFWKDPNDTGSHTGSLWTAAGTLLTTGTFVGETASGWQTLAFATPVSITAGTEYVAGYHTQGNYTADSNYFTAPITNGPLSADMSSSGPGCYTYCASTAFPSIGSTTSNYWVDVVFAPSGVGEPPIANNVSGIAAIENTALAITAASILANDADPNGLALSLSAVSNPINGAVSLDASTGVVTFTPTTGYVGPASFTYTIVDTAGVAASAAVSLTVSPSAIYSLWTTAATPSVLNSNDPNPVELGMKFTSSVGGEILGLRYYKGASDTGSHVGSLWTSSGTLLASATFSNESSSGWQTVTFSSPVSITAGSTYVAAYHSNGDYTDTPSYFTTATTNGPLTALASGSGGDGLYTYGGSSVFPTSSYNSTNYWVDVLFQPAGTTQFLPPVANNDTGLLAVQSTPVLIEASALLANDSDPNGLAVSISGVSNASNSTVSFNAATAQITFTPTAGFTGTAGFTYSISDSAGGTASASAAVSVSSSSALQASSVFTPDLTPTTISVNDPNAVELGMKFTSSTGGVITGAEFYKSAQNTGVHTAELWDSTGALLASAQFANETASGWQTVAFATPVFIAAGQTDIISYHTNTGFYSADANTFAASQTNGVLTAPSSTSIGGNGVYAYGSAVTFPTNTYNSNNYWVDVIMQS
jgi:hypothetical protein